MHNTLKVTASTVYPIKEPKGKLRAFARVILNDQIQLTSLRIYDGVKGLFVSYPNDPNHKGNDYKQLFYPVTKELRSEIEESILDKFNDVQTQVG